MFLPDEMVYRCVECAGEVCDGMCQFCSRRYSYEVRLTTYTDAINRKLRQWHQTKPSVPQTPPENSDNALYHSSVLTENTYMQADRLAKQRGATLIRIEEATHALASRRNGKWPHGDRSMDECCFCLSDGDYYALIGRGATDAMIETFQMEFSEKEAITSYYVLLLTIIIKARASSSCSLFARTTSELQHRNIIFFYLSITVAWADETLFRKFTTNVMGLGDQWKIYLSRRILLSHNDADGSISVEELTDEIMHRLRCHKWATDKQVGTIVWATKAVEFGRNADEDAMI